MKILGINAYHGDSSACLVVDGILVNAIEEERIRRIKHWAGFPIESIKWCISNAGLSITDIDYIAISRDPSAHLHKKILRTLIKTPSVDFIKNRISNLSKISTVKTAIATGFNLDISDIKAQVKNVEHHKSHIASTFFVSPFDEAACITVDGFGDFLSTMRAFGKGTNIKIYDWVEYPHSLGIFYTALTQYLGFKNYGDEYKVMGLSAYGKPVYLEKMRGIVKLKKNGLFELDTTFFNHTNQGTQMMWENGKPEIDILYSDKLIDCFGKSRLNNDDEITRYHMDLASSIQAMYEEVFFHILNDFFYKTNCESITLAGGCIQNSLANGKIKDKTKFKNIYIPPASYDAGTAIGASIYVWYKISNSNRSFVMESPYLGPKYKEQEIKDCIENHNLELAKMNCKIELVKDELELCKKTAKLIENGNVIGWFQGMSEFGPRALGNRSIVCDPRKPEMKDILNERIKRREWFRPFAPSILEEKVSEWFECMKDDSVPFMEKVFMIKETKQKLIPAVCHMDGTGRLQTISSKLNPKYYNLIKEFENLTGVPIILNTSFNENEPIVNTPSEAIECFIRTKMDNLVLEDFLITKNHKK